MAKQVSAVVILAILATVMTVSGTSCVTKSKEEQLPVAQLPVIEIGNKWVYRLLIDNFESNATLEVTGEDVIDGKDCYVIEVSFEPALFTIKGWTSKIEKSLSSINFPIMTQMTYSEVPFSSVVEYSYTFPGESWWPLDVGKEIQVVETSTETTGSTNEEETQTETKATTYKVVGVEEITVVAGTFECFKIVEYDEDGYQVSISWYSDVIRNNVELIDYETGYTLELKFYSLL